MRRTKVFVDSDVVISSLLSRKGAAHLLLNEQNSSFFISNISKNEIEVVAERLNIEQNKPQDLIKKCLKVIKLKKEISKIKEDFRITVLTPAQYLQYLRSLD